MQRRKEWRLHLKVLSEKRFSFQSIHGSVLQLPPGLGEYIRGSPPSILDCGLLENRGCALPFDASFSDHQSAKNIITINPMLEERMKEYMKKQSRLNHKSSMTKSTLDLGLPETPGIALHANSAHFTSNER